MTVTVSSFEWIKVWGPEAAARCKVRASAGLALECIAEEPTAPPPPSPYEEAVAVALGAVQNAIAAAKQCGRDGHADSLSVAEGFVERVLRHTRNPDS